MADTPRVIQGDAGVDCPCGGRMLVKRFDEVPRQIACPRCGRTPLDLLTKAKVIPDA